MPSSAQFLGCGVCRAEALRYKKRVKLVAVAGWNTSPSHCPITFLFASRLVA
jgi:hypothetical protein